MTRATSPSSGASGVPPPRETAMPPSAEPRSPLASLLEALAQAVESRRGHDVIARLLTDTHAACQDAAARASGEAKTHLTNFLQALETWHRLWPQMGARPEFQQAVVREARAWANRVRKFL